MTTGTIEPVAAIEDLTASWLTAALGADIQAVSAEPVGTGQMGTCYRLALSGSSDLPPTMLAKLPATEGATREFLHGSYKTEVTFYRDLLHTTQVAAPATYYAAISEDPDQRGTFTLLLEDLTPAVQGDQIAGCTAAQAQRAVENAAGLHASYWNNVEPLRDLGFMPAASDDAEIMNTLFPEAVETVVSMLGASIDPEDAATLRTLSRFGGRWLQASPGRLSLVHGDYRLDNLLFGDTGRLWAVDWQTLAVGLPTRDIALLISSGLPTEVRREHERGIVEAYRRRLFELGIGQYAQQECWDDYRLSLVQTPLIAVFGCAYSSVRTPRGDEMFATMIRRGTQAIRDLGTQDLLEAL